MAISKETMQKLDEMAAKSKRACALCDQKLSGRTPPKGHTGKVWCSWVGLRHPTKKSKSYRLCGDCYAAIRQEGAQRGEKGGSDEI